MRKDNYDHSSCGFNIFECIGYLSFSTCESRQKGLLLRLFGFDSFQAGTMKPKHNMPTIGSNYVAIYSIT
jgi:hypothetical protein